MIEKTALKDSEFIKESDRGRRGQENISAPIIQVDYDTVGRWAAGQGAAPIPTTNRWARLPEVHELVRPHLVNATNKRFSRGVRKTSGRFAILEKETRPRRRRN